MSNNKINKDRSCFVPGCKTGYSADKKSKKLQGEINPSLFKAPNDPAVLKEWSRAIPRGDKIFGPNNVVCSLHFADEEILYFHETKMPDGSIHKIKRGRPTLKEGSVPSKFPSSSRKRQKSPCTQTESAELKKKKTDSSEEPQSSSMIEAKNYEENEGVTVADSSVSAEEGKNLELFQCLKYSLDTVSTPNGSWSGTFLPGRNEIIFAEWDETYTTKKKIVIHHDMSYKVLLGSAEVKIIGRDRIISDFSDLEDMIKLVNKMRVCEGITS